VQLKMNEAEENDKYVQVQAGGKAVKDNDGNLLFQNLKGKIKIDIKHYTIMLCISRF
jgi:hypothetical protein